MNKPEEFVEEMKYLLTKVNWGSSFLDARAATFLNTWKAEFDQLTGPTQEDLVGNNKYDLNGGDI